MGVEGRSWVSKSKSKPAGGGSGQELERLGVWGGGMCEIKSGDSTKVFAKHLTLMISIILHRLVVQALLLRRTAIQK